MEALISEKVILNSHNLPSPPFLARPKPNSPPFKHHLFLHFSNRNLNPRKPNFCSISNPPASVSSNYGGWDDLKLIQHPTQSGKLKGFLVSVGIDDGKHVFMFITGLISALAISRVRVSTVLVFPASVLVFAIGFSFGFIRSRFGKGIKEENPPRVYAEKLRNSVEFFNELNDKISNLEKEMKGSMSSNFVQVGELESYHNVLKNISLDIARERNVMEASTNDVGKPDCASESSRESVDSGEVERKLNQKLSRRKGDIGGAFADIFQFVSGVFRGSSSVGSKANVSKNISKREGMEPLNSNTVNDQIRESKVPGGLGDDDSLNRVSMDSVGNMKKGTSLHEVSRNPAYDHLGDEILGGGSRNVEEPRMGNGKSVESGRNIRKLLESEEYYNQSNTSQFLNKKGYGSGKEVQVPIESCRDGLDAGFNIRPGKVESGAFGMEHKTYIQESKFSRSDTAGISNKYNVENKMHRFDLRETPENLVSGFELGNHQSRCDMEEGSASSSTSAMISEDVVFDRHLMDATNLLKQARECLKGKVDEERAEAVLYKSARLLSKALSMKPMSLLAVGQLGNTFLLHGELKLKISRELRNLPSTGDSFSREKMYGVKHEGHDKQGMDRDKIASTLVDVCEECEELLVEAGRKYKTALSIDGNDVRALYNWGLALSYRAQLISDIGPEAAYDADKVYLAAIDKFDAIMSKSNAYASDALFRWGMVLRQRSQLRPRYSEEKLKLLHQAKRLFEDALSMDSDNHQVKEALSSCISDLSFGNL